VRMDKYDAVLYFPPDFTGRSDALRQAIKRGAEAAVDDGEQGKLARTAPEVPSPEIIYTTAREESQIAFARLSDVLRRWTESIGEANLAAAGIPASAARPFRLQNANLADESGRHGVARWSKILPMILLLWALTGAFYPAVDLCAGEKERGTLETLLSSPAERSEIVLGKLLTIMLFSMITAALNLLSIGTTGWALLAQFPELGTPPPLAAVWLLLALVPVSALFSALCLALAAFARSTKEGQYYLMPLLLVIMPLVIVPMAPGVELNLGNSLIPVTGLMLLLRSLLEGNHWQALQFFPSVAAVTLVGCLLAIRWAVDQFNAESVLFRESERLDVGLWLQRLVRDRRPTPTVAAAVFCGVLVLLIRFFISFSVPQPKSFQDFAALQLLTELGVIAAPALLMTIILTGNPRQTLLLVRPAWRTLPAAALLAVVMNPIVSVLQVAVMRLYPVSDSIRQALEEWTKLPGEFWQLVLVMAVLPAVCEELAFRGFILSGFRHLGHKWRAIVYASLFFGITHAVFQQSLIASLVGVVIGYLAVQSGSLLPCIVFHVVHNTLMLASTQLPDGLCRRWEGLRLLIAPAEGGGYVYQWPVVVAGAAAALLLLSFFSRLPYPKSPEEQLQEAIDKGV